jgi:phosphoenolpyruvate carboxykinase (ATP)
LITFCFSFYLDLIGFRIALSSFSLLVLIGIWSIVNEVNGLEIHGITNADVVYWNLPTPALYEEAIRRREATVAHLGALLVRTGDHMGRSPNDRFIVREESTEKDIWWGKINSPFEESQF